MTWDCTIFELYKLITEKQHQELLRTSSALLKEFMTGASQYFWTMLIYNLQNDIAPQAFNQTHQSSLYTFSAHKARSTHPEFVKFIEWGPETDLTDQVLNMGALFKVEACALGIEWGIVCCTSQLLSVLWVLMIYVHSSNSEFGPIDDFSGFHYGWAYETFFNYIIKALTGSDETKKAMEALLDWYNQIGTPASSTPALSNVAIPVPQYDMTIITAATASSSATPAQAAYSFSPPYNPQPPPTIVILDSSDRFDQHPFLESCASTSANANIRSPIQTAPGNPFVANIEDPPEIPIAKPIIQILPSPKKPSKGKAVETVEVAAEDDVQEPLGPLPKKKRAPAKRGAKKAPALQPPNYSLLSHTLSGHNHDGHLLQPVQPTTFGSFLGKFSCCIIIIYFWMGNQQVCTASLKA
ncbi:hypothetical protein FA15DRAFT_655654 [Coprinopsis marcescibilis]|uniref:Uncharacterized protein n=1 Tax=Coprinopsis marcescibilis TaxID=230819 RepID=A0A5C3KWI5_COPMA|nr:hypothetical protein FA15DRAFT_655654 [Coprinopsis marcescibilis]